ncbi:hypothetical protein ACE6H2_004169 [Prunus campanulata]
MTHITGLCGFAWPTGALDVGLPALVCLLQLSCSRLGACFANTNDGNVGFQIKAPYCPNLTPPVKSAEIFQSFVPQCTKKKKKFGLAL